MPLTIDEEKLSKMQTLDMSLPQGSPHGIPVKAIPHLEYPRCVYKHPVETFREVIHRNVNHEVVHRELVPTEHRVHVCHSKAEYDKKISEGWTDKPYIPQAPPDETDALYRSSKRGEQGTLKEVVK